MKPTNIVIDDENCYFSAGLKISIIQYAQEKNKKIKFLQPDEVALSDMLIVSSQRRAQRWRRTGYCGTMPVVTIKEKPVAAARETTSVLYRTDDQNRLFSLLNEVLSGSDSVLIKRPLLTPRERQVVGYFRRGLDQSQTARLLGVSVKTVHSHKRSVMSKLMLNRHHEFLYWLLSQEGEYS